MNIAKNDYTQFFSNIRTIKRQIDRTIGGINQLKVTLEAMDHQGIDGSDIRQKIALAEKEYAALDKEYSLAVDLAYYIAENAPDDNIYMGCILHYVNGLTWAQTDASLGTRSIKDLCQNYLKGGLTRDVL